MHKSVIAILLIANIAFSSAVFLKKPATATFSVFNELQEVENSDFGKKILDTIALQMKNKSPLQDVAKMLAEIRGDLSAQQLASDQLHDQQEAECANEIKEYERRITVADGIRQQAEDEIASLKQEISRLEGDIRNKKQQLDILNQREIDLRESRARDADDFARRQAQSVEVIGALDLIIEKFSTIKGVETA
jgi:septal ring factor EnvC (AmiA/AmiB activator)